jgi:diacylglycerol kinase (ATP)
LKRKNEQNGGQRLLIYRKLTEKDSIRTYRKKTMTIATPENSSAVSELRDKRRCLILANPKAGALSVREFFANFGRRYSGAPEGAVLRTVPQIPPATLTLLAEVAAAAGLEANVEVVPPPERLPDLLRTAQQEGFDTIVAVGGDGTVRTLAQGLVGSPLRLGILPMGTSNNFARALGIPFQLEAAMRVVAEGVERQVDVGRIGGEYFLEAAGVGLFADALLACGREELRRHQVLRMLRLAGPLCWNPRARRLQLILDGTAQKEEAIMVAVSNGAYMGESWPVAPDAALTDSQFDVVIVGALNRWELIRFGSALMRGRHLDLPKVRRVRAATVEIRRAHRAHRPLPVHADDHIAAYTPAWMQTVPRALRVMMPSPAPLSPVPTAQSG